MSATDPMAVAWLFLRREGGVAGRERGVAGRERRIAGHEGRVAGDEFDGHLIARKLSRDTDGAVAADRAQRLHLVGAEFEGETGIPTISHDRFLGLLITGLASQARLSEKQLRVESEQTSVMQSTIWLGNPLLEAVEVD